jgi:hypothetical protein
MTLQEQEPVSGAPPSSVARLCANALIGVSLLLPWYQFSDAPNPSPGIIVLASSVLAVDPEGWSPVRLLLLLNLLTLLAALWLGHLARRPKALTLYRATLLGGIVEVTTLALLYPDHWLWGIWGAVVCLGIASILSFWLRSPEPPRPPEQ